MAPLAPPPMLKTILTRSSPSQTVWLFVFDATNEIVEFAFTFIFPTTVSESHKIPGVVSV